MITKDRLVGLQDDLTPNLAYVPVNRAPFFLNLARMSGMKQMKSTVITWVDYTSEGTSSLLETAIAATETTSVVVKDASIFSVNNYILADTEAMLVTAVNTANNTLTVTRAQLGTTALGSIAKGTPIYLVNDGIDEGAGLVGATYKPGANFENYSQIIREEIEVSRTAMQLDVPSGSGLDPYDLEEEKKQNTCIGKLEKALVSGVKFQNGLKRGMQGIRFFLDKGQVVTAGDAPLTLDLIDDLVTRCYQVGGELTGGYYALMVSPIQNRILSKILEGKTEVTQGETSLGAVARMVTTAQGNLPIIISNNLPDDEVLLVNFADCEIGIISPLTHEFMGKDGDRTKGLIVGEYSLKVRNIHTQGKIKGLRKTVTP